MYNLVAAFLLSIASTTIAQVQNPRKIILIYTDKGYNLLHEQEQILVQDRKGLHNRDIVIERYLSNSNKELTAKYHISKPFTIILIGKDGGTKLRSNKPVYLDQLFSLIDSMPMRRREMQQEQ